ncbi:MAG: hypothetical protein Q7T48_10015 [Cellvibrio sp.]|uniref:hypothetical protein n=1 Tax=Cellvibrio sp. TaxID=1965322 RepID=UPI00271A8DCA|nr:hypothetical protein [Cellvibrio sp.]
MKIEDILNAPFTFTVRKNFTPCDTRPLWKSCLIILTLGIVGKNNNASLKKIHVANWITKDTTHFHSFMEWEGKDERKRPDVRLEPSIDRIIDLLVSNKIVEKLNGAIELTEKGIEIFKEIDSYEIYMDEKKSLSNVKRYLTDAAIKRLFEGV